MSSRTCIDPHWSRSAVRLAPLLLVLLATVLPMIRSASAAETPSPGFVYDPVADPQATVTVGNARFTFLTPRVVRLEWSADGVFEDRASYVFMNRRLPVPDVAVREVDQGIRAFGDYFTLEYSGSGRLSADNLSISFVVGDETIRWTPGTPNTQNLKGTWRTFDGIDGPSPLEDGLLSRAGWTLIDDSQRVLFDDANPPWAVARPERDAVDWYLFIYGTEYQQALQDFTALSGKIPLPPRYAFGAWWSRWWEYSADELKRLVGEFRENDVPLDVLVIDMDWHLEGWTGYTWNRDLFPDPAGFLRWTDGEGLRVPLNLHPHEGVGRHEDAFEAFAKFMDLDPATAERVPFDATDPKYMQGYFELLHHPIERQGVDFWWIDWQQGTETDIPNLDPLAWLNHLHWVDWLRNPGAKQERPLILSRWGGLGGHRYAVGFSGDAKSTWRSLEWQPYFTATAANVGFAYWSHDIGGFFPNPVPDELFARWVQFGAFAPIFRTHTTNDLESERRIWAFDPPTYRSAKKFWHLRYSLMPYIYTAAYRTHTDARPLIRPLYWEWPDWEQAYAFPNQYYFGDDLIVAPVTTPRSAAALTSTTKVWIPRGDWINWFTGQRVSGPAEIDVVTTLDEMPVFVRVGAMIPRAKVGRNTRDPKLDPLRIDLFLAPRGAGQLFEDDGESLGYQRGEHFITDFSFARDPDRRDQLKIVIDPGKGAFAGRPGKRAYDLCLPDTLPPLDVRIGDETLPRSDGPTEHGWWYDAELLGPRIALARRSTAQRTVVEVTLRQDEEAERVLAAGLRGNLRVLRDFLEHTGFEATEALEAARLGELLARDVEAGLEQIKQFEAEWPRLMLEVALMVGRLEATRAATFSGTTEPDPWANPLPRLLNFGVDFGAQTDDRGATRVTLRATVDPIGTTADRTEITMTPIKAEQARVMNPSSRIVDRVLTAQVELEQPGVPQSELVATTINVAVPNGEVKFDLELDLFPSINHWHVLGPLSTEQADALQADFGARTEFDLEQSVRGLDGTQVGWRAVGRGDLDFAAADEEMLVDLIQLYERQVDNAVIYAVTYIESPIAQRAQLALGSDDSCVVWLNGAEVHRYDEPRGYTSQSDTATINLRRGVNVLLMRVNQFAYSWSFAAHLQRPDGKPLRSVRVRERP